MKTETPRAQRRYVWFTLLASFLLSRSAIAMGLLGLAQLLAWDNAVRLVGFVLLALVVWGVLRAANRLELNGRWSVSLRAHEQMIPNYAGWVRLGADSTIIVLTSTLLVINGGYLSIFPGAYLAKLSATIFLIYYLFLAFRYRILTHTVRAAVAAAVMVGCWVTADTVVPIAWQGEQALAVLLSALTIGAVALLWRWWRKKDINYRGEPKHP